MSRTALVTGAASGNGTAIVSRFLADGYRVAAIDINTENLEKTRDRHWSKSENQVLCLTGDVSSEADTGRFVDATLSRWNAIDVLVNNAGITGNETAMELHTTDTGEFDRVIAVNVRGIFLGCKFTLPHMLEKGTGIIINIASVAGLVAFPGRAAYSISKGAVAQLTRSVAIDYADKGIRCNAVCPGFIDTPMVRWRLEQPELRARLLERIPQHSIGEASDVAGAVAFLAGPDAGYFNGACLVMDGAYTAL